MKKRLMNDNRGAALVSIMIAVAFITILATALLYMSYNNFQMKVINYDSKVNFYEVEHDLVVASTAIRDKVFNDAANPMQTLKEVVGWSETSEGIQRYNPEKLAQLVYASDFASDPGTDPSSWIKSSPDKNITFTAKTLTGTNFEVTNESADVKKVILHDVIIQHVDNTNGTINTIETDLVYRIKEDTLSEDPGGIGEFSVLMDGNLGAGDGYPTRIVTYGNVFVGPDDYVYYTDPDTLDETINPAGANAINLGGSTVLTVNGDYMVVFGNIVLDGDAVLYVASGKLTVYGDVIVKGNASFICKGNLFFPEGNKPGTTEPYGINVSAGNENNVIPSTLLTDPASVCKYVNATDYASVIEQLKLDNDDTDDDGILKQLIDSTYYEDMKDTQESDTNNDRMDVNGMAYRPYFNGKATQNLNGGDAFQATLLFNSASDTTIQNTSLMNTTLISFTPMSFNNQHTYLFSQIGEEAFEQLTACEDEDYDEDVHLIQAGSLSFKCTEVFNANANIVVNKVLQKSTGGDTGTPVVDVVFGYENWSRE